MNKNNANNTRLMRICHTLATLGPIGYLPAPGTITTVLTAAVLFLLAQFGVPALSIRHALLPLIILGTIVIHYAVQQFNKHDPSEIVLDEVLGYTFASSLFPHTLLWLCATVIIFRFFDIIKPLGIKKLEQISGATGILLDDLLAAVYTQIFLILLCMGYDTWFR